MGSFSFCCSICPEALAMRPGGNLPKGTSQNCLRSSRYSVSEINMWHSYQREISLHRAAKLEFGLCCCYPLLLITVQPDMSILQMLSDVLTASVAVLTECSTIANTFSFTVPSAWQSSTVIHRKQFLTSAGLGGYTWNIFWHHLSSLK